MATPFPSWILDESGNQYFYYSVEENAYVYQTGEMIPLNEPFAGSSGSGAAQSYDIP